MTLVVAAAAAGTRGLGPARGGSVAGGTTERAFLIRGCVRCRGRLGRWGFRSQTCFFLSRQTSLLGSGLLGLAVFLGAAAFVHALGTLGAILALARLLRQAEAILFRLALHAL